MVCGGLLAPVIGVGRSVAQNNGSAPSTRSARIVNPQSVALLRWYQANEAAEFEVAPNPSLMAFDGTNLWVNSTAAGTLSKIRPVDGVTVATYSIPGEPTSLVYDGSHIWAVGPQTVSKIKIADGSIFASYNNSGGAGNIWGHAIFDGTYIWLGNFNGTLTKVRVKDGTLSTIQSPDTFPTFGLAFDGRNVWVLAGPRVRVVRASDGTLLSDQALFGGTPPTAIVFDGVSMWISYLNLGVVVKVNARTSVVLDIFSTESRPGRLVFDGSDIWVINTDGDSVTKLRGTDGSVLGTFKVGKSPVHLTFDGVNVWVTNRESATISKL
jgi:hypothetical protein